MAINEMAKAKQITWTGLGSPIKDIQNWEATPDCELEEYIPGNANVARYYKGEDVSQIVIETGDLAAISALSKGDILAAIVLTVAAAIDSEGNAIGGEATFTMSKGIVAEAITYSHGSTGNKPVLARLVLKIARAHGDTSDPTFTIAAV